MPPLYLTDKTIHDKLSASSELTDEATAFRQSTISNLTSSNQARPASPRRRPHSSDRADKLHHTLDRHPRTGLSPRAFFKKPRTASPSTEGNSDSDSPQPVSIVTNFDSPSQLQTHGMDAFESSGRENKASEGGDKAVDHLITERSLSLNDGQGDANRIDQVLQSPVLSTEDALSDANGATKCGNSISTDTLISRGDHLPSYAAVPARPSGPQQMEFVKMHKDKPLSLGSTWFVLSRSWYRAWSVTCSTGEILGEQTPDGLAMDNAVPVGPIDCSSLSADPSAVEVGSRPALRLHLTEGIDYELVPEELWTSLTTWYGLDGPIFPRRVIAKPLSSDLVIELYPPRFDVYELSRSDDEEVTMPLRVTSLVMSITANILELKEQVSQAFDWAPDGDPNNTRFFRLRSGVPESLRSQYNHTEHASALRSILQDAELLDAGEDSLATDLQTSSLGTLQLDQPYEMLGVDRRRSSVTPWSISSPALTTDLNNPGPLPARPLFAQDNSNDSFSALEQKKKKAPVTSVAGNSSASSFPRSNHGITSGAAASDRILRSTRSQSTGDHSKGLQNLGNTCFMNSALQCLSNTPELQEYFVSNAYASELNTDNPLGQGGALARAFGLLLQKLWAPHGPNSIVPREFKTALARFAPQFTGYAQQDTQELLAFLLDGLHEDLNRIHKKPYIETPDWEGGGVKEMVLFAKKQWELYKLRNDSIIVDLFQGQYRSTLVCPVCDKVSIKFDPFMYLTLPIPNHKKWKGEIHFVPANLSKPTFKTLVELPQTATLFTLRNKIAALFDADVRKLVVGEIHSKRIYRWYFDYEAISEIAAGDIVYCWELPSDYVPPRREATSRYLHSAYPTARHPSVSEHGNPPPEEETAILPVFCETVKSNDTFRHDAQFGLPFLIAVPRSEMDDVEAVQNLVISHLSRYSSSPEAFMEAAAHNGYAQAHDRADFGAPMAAEPVSTVSTEWEMVDSTHSNSALVSSPARDTNEVAEFHDGGESVRMVLDQTNLIVDDGTKSSADSVIQRPIFRIAFSTRMASQPMPTAAGAAEAEDLICRLKRLNAERRKYCAHSTPAGTDSDMPDANTKDKVSIASDGTKPWPTLYTGGALVCTFDPSARKLFFDEGPLRRDEWGTVETLHNAEAHRAGPPQKVKLTLEDCLDEFTREEQLGEEDPWYCPQCKEFRQATKKFDLWKVPDLLVVHLKRFSSGRNSRDKLDGLVEFPSHGLDLSDRVEGPKAVKLLEEAGEDLSQSLMLSMSDGHLQPSFDANDDAVAADQPIYDLYAVDNHYGGLGGGHYTAHAKNPADSKWYYFDDSSVRPTTDEDARSRAAYVLFYRRRTTRLIGGKTRDVILQQQETASRNHRVDASNSNENSGINGVSAMHDDLGDVAGPSYQYPYATQNTLEHKHDSALSGPYETSGSYDEETLPFPGDDDILPFPSTFSPLRPDEGFAQFRGDQCDSDSIHANRSDDEDEDAGSVDANLSDVDPPSLLPAHGPDSANDGKDTPTSSASMGGVD